MCLQFLLFMVIKQKRLFDMAKKSLLPRQQFVNTIHTRMGQTMQPVPVSLQYSRNNCQMVESLFFWQIELSIINSMVIYFQACQVILEKKQPYGLCRTQLIHDLVQPLLNVRADTTISRKQTNSSENRLKGRLLLPDNTLSKNPAVFVSTKKGEPVS